MSSLISPLSETVIADAAQSIADGTAVDLRAVDHADRAKVLGTVIGLIEQRIFLQKAKAALPALRNGDLRPAAELFARDHTQSQLKLVGGFPLTVAEIDDFVREFFLSAEGMILLNVLAACISAATGSDPVLIIAPLPVCPFSLPALRAERYAIRRYLMYRINTLGLSQDETPADAARLSPAVLAWANSLSKAETTQLAAMGHGAVQLDLAKIEKAGQERRAIFGRHYAALGIRLDTVAPHHVTWAVPILAAPLPEEWADLLKEEFNVPHDVPAEPA